MAVVYGLVKALVLVWIDPAFLPPAAGIVLVVNVAGTRAADRLLAGFNLEGRMGRLGAPVLMSVLDIALAQAARSFLHVASQA